jgi:hypothetical protein
MHSERDSSPVEDDHRSTNRRTSSAAMTTFTQNPVALRHQSCQSCRWASARVATLSVAFLVPMHDNTSRRQSVSLPLRPATRCSHIGGHAVDVTEKRWNSSTARERRGSLQPTTLTAGASWVVGSSSVNRPHDNRRRVSFDATADTTNSLSITSDAAPSSQHESQNRADSSR